MATRQLSSSLMNLKFMQRAIQREEMLKKQGEEDVKIDAAGDVRGFAFPSAVSIQPSRCLVVIEGEPRPAAVRGRMSFKGFNPLIEKLSEATANTNDDHQRKHYETQNLNNLSKTNYSSSYKGLSFNNQNQASANPNGYRKRKQFEEVCDTQYPKQWHKTNQGYRQPSLNTGRDPFKKPENTNFKTNQGYRQPSQYKGRDPFKKPENTNFKTRPFLGNKQFNEKRFGDSFKQPENRYFKTRPFLGVRV